MLDSFCPIPKCLTTHLSYHRFLVDGAPRALIIAKTKNNHTQGQEEKVLHPCLMSSRFRWEGRCLRLKTSTFKLCHIICQLLGSALDNVDGVKAVFFEPTFRPSLKIIVFGNRGVVQDFESI